MTNKLDKQALQDKAWEILMVLLTESSDDVDRFDDEFRSAMRFSYSIAATFLSFDTKTLKKMEDDK